MIKEDSEYPEWLWSVLDPLVRVQVRCDRLVSGAIEAPAVPVCSDPDLRETHKGSD